jgi:hypothetical protein
MAINTRLLRINDEMLETIDEELELEIDDDRLAKLLGEVAEHRQEDALERGGAHESCRTGTGQRQLASTDDGKEHETSISMAFVSEPLQSAGLSSYDAYS